MSVEAPTSAKITESIPALNGSCSGTVNSLRSAAGRDYRLGVFSNYLAFSGLQYAPRQKRYVAFSCRNYFFTNEMQADKFWSFPLVEMTTHSIPNLPLQGLDVIRLGVDGLAHGAGMESPLMSLLNEKEYFIHGYVLHHMDMWLNALRHHTLDNHYIAKS